MTRGDTSLLLRFLNSITDPLAFYDREFRINLVNQALVSLYQLTPDRVIGRHCYEVFHQREAVCDLRVRPCLSQMGHHVLGNGTHHLKYTRWQTDRQVACW